MDLPVNEWIALYLSLSLLGIFSGGTGAGAGGLFFFLGGNYEGDPESLVSV